MRASLILIINFIFLILLVRQIVKVILAFWTNLTTDVPFHQTKRQIISQVEVFLHDQLVAKEKLILYELGAGDGRLSLALADKLPLQAVAVELNPVLVLFGKLKTWIRRLSPKVSWLKANLFDVDLSQADVVYLYLLTEVNQRLIPKLESELSLGSKVISWKFNLKSDQFRLVHQFGQKSKLRVFEKI